MYVEFAQRLAVAMAAQSIKHSPTVLANQFNTRFQGRAVTSHTARNWMLGKSLPTQDKMICLANFLDTSAEQLRYGRHSLKTLNIQNHDGSETELTESQQQLVRKYISLNLVQQRLVSDLVGELAG
jgi:hypothetical protein